MKRLENGDYIVPAIRASEAIEVVRGRVDVPAICAVKVPSLDGEWWLVHPHYRGHESCDDDSHPADCEWIKVVVPTGWSISIDTKLGLLLIRSQTRSLYFVQAFTTTYVSRALIRSSFAKLGMVIG